MPIPELVLKNAEKLCDELCARLNAEPSAQHLYGYRVEGETLTLYARTGCCKQMLTLPLARFRYSAELAQWALQYYDDERWRPYLNAGPCLNLGQLVVHVESDPFGFFRAEPPDPELA